MAEQPQPLYTDNGIEIGSRVEDLKRADGTAVGTFHFDSIELDFPGGVVERTNAIGAPNGWALVAKAQTGTAVVQIPTAASKRPKLGDYFEDVFDDSDEEAESQRWVVTRVGKPYEKEGYRKCNVNLRLSENPPAPPAP